MRDPLISLWRHGHQILLAEGAAPAQDRPAAGLARRHFLQIRQALEFLRFWRGDGAAMADLRRVLQRLGTSGSAANAASMTGLRPDELLQALAERLWRGTLVVYEVTQGRPPPGRLVLAPVSELDLLAGLPALTDLPALPVLPPLLPVLEEVQIEGAEVMPEVNQSLAQIAATLGSVGGASASLTPAPDKVPEVRTAMEQASADLRRTLDAL